MSSDRPETASSKSGIFFLSGWLAGRGQLRTLEHEAAGETSSVSKRSARARKPTAKLKEALTCAPASKNKRTVIITDDEDEARPQRRKIKPKVVEGNPDSDVDSVNLDEGPRKPKARVFSQASEDAQDTRANTEASSNLDDSGNVSTGEANATDAKGWSSDEE